MCNVLCYGIDRGGVLEALFIVCGGSRILQHSVGSLHDRLSIDYQDEPSEGLGALCVQNSSSVNEGVT